MIANALLALALQTAPVSAAPPPRRQIQPSSPVRMEGEREPLAAVRIAVRAEVNRLYSHQCGRIELPDRAFVPVELSGADNPEYAVLLGRAVCAKWPQFWEGTGGAMVQFWYASDGPPRMLMERMVRGFTPKPEGVDLLQHGTYCPGGAGPNVCLVSYRWHEKDRALYPIRRTLIDGRRGQTWPKMQWDDTKISR